MLRFDLNFWKKKLRPVDYIFILLAILLALFFLSYFSRKRVSVFVDLTYQRQEWNDESFPPEYWEIGSLEIGDVGYSSAGRKVVEVKDIEKNVWDGGNRMYFEISVELDAVYNSTTHTYIFDGSPLLIGNDLEIQIGQTELTGVISNVYENEQDRFLNYKRADAEIVVHYRQYDPWHAEALRDFTVTNSKGEVILKTKDIEITPAEKVVVTDRGEVFLNYDPVRKDATVTFELPNVLCSEDVCYYNHYTTLMVGEEFAADSEKTYVAGGSIMSSIINYHE